MERTSGPLDTPFSGFVSFGPITFILWMAGYGLAGWVMGTPLQAPVVGVFLALVIGLYPSAALGMGDHYGAWFVLVPIAFYACLPFLSPPALLWISVGFVLLPYLLMIPVVLGDRGERARKKREGEELNTKTPDELLTLLHASANGAYDPVSVIAACGRTGSPTFVEPLSRLLEEHGSKMDGVREAAATALMELGGDEAEAVLRRALEREKKAKVRSLELIDLLGKALGETED